MIPEGMRDVLPPETGRLRAVEDLLRTRFAAYGYGEVRTPWLEFAETLESADDDTLSAGYRLHDERGHELMVRTDMTVPVARMAADRCDDDPLPLRFTYVAPSIRPWAPQRGQDGEFQQAGVELLGLDSAEADAECVTLLCDALAGLGLRDFTVTLGSASFQRALIESLGLPDEDRRKFKEALGDRDYPLVESIAGNADVEWDVLKALWRVLELSGGEEVLGQARKLARNHVMETAVTRLARVRDLVEDAGFGDRLAFDFGLMQDLDYYSGLLLEAYAPGVGLPLASGGRYDGLLARFGWDIPGVGFAVAVDRAADALDEAGVELSAGRVAIPFVGGLEAPARAAELRRAGLLVAALPEDATRGGAAAAASSRRLLRAPARRRPRGDRRRPGDRRGAGGRVRIGIACEAGPPPAELLDLLEAAGLPAASLRGERPPALLAAAGGAWLLAGAADVLRACERGALDLGVVGKDRLLEGRRGTGELVDLRCCRDDLVFAVAAGAGAARPAAPRGHPPPGDGAPPLRRRRRPAGHPHDGRAGARAGARPRRRRRRARHAPRGG